MLFTNAILNEADPNRGFGTQKKYRHWQEDRFKVNITKNVQKLKLVTFFGLMKSKNNMNDLLLLVTPVYACAVVNTYKVQ